MKRKMLIHVFESQFTSLSMTYIPSYGLESTLSHFRFKIEITFAAKIISLQHKSGVKPIAHHRIPKREQNGKTDCPLSTVGRGNRPEVAITTFHLIPYKCVVIGLDGPLRPDKSRLFHRINSIFDRKYIDKPFLVIFSLFIVEDQIRQTRKSYVQW